MEFWGFKVEHVFFSFVCQSAEVGFLCQSNLRYLSWFDDLPRRIPTSMSSDVDFLTHMQWLTFNTE